MTGTNPGTNLHLEATKLAQAEESDFWIVYKEVLPDSKLIRLLTIYDSSVVISLVLATSRSLTRGSM